MRRLRTVRGFFPTRPCLGVLGSLVLIAMVSAFARSAEPDRSPRRYLPARGLVAYLEYEGLDAHARAWEATAAHDMLVKTPAGAMLTDIFRQLIGPSIELETLGQVHASEVMASADRLVRKGFAFGFYCPSLDDCGAVLVLKSVDRKAIAEGIDRLRRFQAFADGDDAGTKSAPCRIRGREVYQFRDGADEGDAKNPLHVDEPPGSTPEPPSPPFLSAWMEGDDLILVLGTCGGQPAAAKAKAMPDGQHDSVAIVLDTIEGKQPDVTTHAGFLSAMAEGKDLKGFEPNGLFFVEQMNDSELGPLFLVGVAAEVGELVLGPLIDRLLSTYDDAKPADPKSGTGAVAGPMPKKDDEFDLTSMDQPKVAPAPGAVKAGDKAKDDKPTAEKPDRSAKGAPAASRPEPKLAARPQGGELDDLDDDVDWLDVVDSPEQLELTIAKQLGLDGFKRVVGRWGFQGKALLTDVRIEAPSPRRGVAACFEQPTFRKDRLPTIPPEASDFVLASFDPEGFYRKIVETARGIEPEFADEFTLVEGLVRDAIGLRLREDLLRHVGPTWAIVDVPSRAGQTGHPARAGRKQTVLIASVDDADAFEKVADSLSRRVDEALQHYAESERKKAPKGQEIGAFGMKRLPAPARGYRIDVPGFVFMEGDEEPLTLKPGKNKMGSLFLLISKSSIALAMDCDAARGVLAAQEPPARWWKPSGELANALDGLPENLTFLSVTDPALCGLPGWIAALPDMIRWTMISETLSDDLDNKTCWTLLNLMDVPRPGQLWLRVDPAKVPKVEELRRYVFSSVLATAVDDRGFRMIHRQPLPFAGLASEIAVSHKWSIEWNEFSRPEMKFLLAVMSARVSSDD